MDVALCIKACRNYFFIKLFVASFLFLQLFYSFSSEEKLSIRPYGESDFQSVDAIFSDNSLVLHQTLQSDIEISRDGLFAYVATQRVEKFSRVLVNNYGKLYGLISLFKKTHLNIQALQKRLSAMDVVIDNSVLRLEMPHLSKSDAELESDSSIELAELAVDTKFSFMHASHHKILLIYEALREIAEAWPYIKNVKALLLNQNYDDIAAYKGAGFIELQQSPYLEKRGLICYGYRL